MSDDEYQDFRVKRDGNSDLKFTGICIAEVWNSADKASGNWSGSTGRSQELTLYRTKAGKYVCQSIGRTQWQNEHDRFTAAVASDLYGVFSFFGHDRLAKELYRSAGLDDVQEVE